MTKIVVEDADGKRFVAQGVELRKIIPGKFEVVRDEVRPVVPLPQAGKGVEMRRVKK